MNILEEVKLLLGINYNDELKDKEILGMIKTGSEFLINTGWHVTNINNKSFISALVIYIKYYQNSELPTYDLLDNKLFKSLIEQNKGLSKVITFENQVIPQEKINELEEKIKQLELEKLNIIDANNKFDAINTMLVIIFNNLSIDSDELGKIKKLITITEKRNY